VTAKDTPEEAKVKKEQIMKNNLLGVLGTKDLTEIDVTDLTSATFTATAEFQKRSVARNRRAAEKKKGGFVQPQKREYGDGSSASNFDEGDEGSQYSSASAGGSG
jgi:hypothetical protein